jgi:hypothetical protein
LIQPRGYGGSSGFGTEFPDPIQCPYPYHTVVVIGTTIDQTRAAGMRVISFNNDDDNLADIVIFSTVTSVSSSSSSFIGEQATTSRN